MNFKIHSVSKNKNAGVNLLSLLILLLINFSCYQKEELNVPIRENETLEGELDLFIEENFTREYGMAIRYRYVDNYVSPTQRVAPPRIEVVRPMLDFIQYFWIDPYLNIDNGGKFFRNHVPAEIVFLGGPIFNSDGTVTLGTADAGAQITFTDVNSIDENDFEWRDLQLNVVYHEFAHIVHQRYKLPSAFETISPTGYTSAGSWFVLTDEEAIQRGFVSPYATSSPNEDFAETVAFFLFTQDFYNIYFNEEANCITANCEALNKGREMIRQKLSAIQGHYLKVTGVNLEELRSEIQSRL